MPGTDKESPLSRISANCVHWPTYTTLFSINLHTHCRSDTKLLSYVNYILPHSPRNNVT